MSSEAAGAARDGGPVQSSSDRAYKTMKARLRRREYQPGQFLSESLLAKELDMSRTPVREAVQRLAQEGVLNVIPKRGIMVSTLSLDDVEEVYAIREVLEGLAAGISAARAGDEDVTRLRAILERTVNAPDDVEQLTELDHEFHAEIARQSSNGRLQSLLANMRDADLLQQYGRRDKVHRARYRTTSLAEHSAVVEAIAARTPLAAEERMREHCRSAARFLAEYIVGAAPRRDGLP
jgi:DNA-binding GntR family transcriptional regulator